jgi:elongation factor G
VFENKVVGGSVPKEFIPRRRKGPGKRQGIGLLAGFPVIDFKATLVDGAYHDVDSSALAFEIAARAAFREAAQKGAQAARADHEGRGGDAGRYTGRRHRRPEQPARPDPGQDMRGNAQVITAMVPLANMFGYVNNLRSA